MIALPNTLSGLLDLAVQDAQKCEALPELYRLDMGRWHTPEAGVCVICMAGAVIAQTLGVSHASDVRVWLNAPCSAALEPARKQLLAINDMRLGDFEDAVKNLGLRLTERQEDACQSARQQIRLELPWEADDEDEENGNAPNMRAPWSTYLEAVAQLREVGL